MDFIAEWSILTESSWVYLRNSTAQPKPEELKESKSAADFPSMCPPTFFFFFCSKTEQHPSGCSSLFTSFSVQLFSTSGDGNDTSSVSDSLWTQNRSSLQTFERTRATLWAFAASGPPWSILGLEPPVFLWRASPWLPPTESSVIKARLITAQLYIRHQSTLYPKNSSFWFQRPRLESLISKTTFLRFLMTYCSL